MAYPDVFGDVDDPAFAGAERTVGLGAVAGWLGALTSLTLVAGLGVWVWDLATRDAGSVPVIQAMEGPSRAAPEDPGGFQAAHQGFSVNAVASEAEEPPLAERVVLAPEPVGPTEADVAAAGAARTDAIRSAVDGALSEILGAPPAAEASGEAAAPAATLPRPAPRPDPADLVTRAAAQPAPLGTVTAPLAPQPAVLSAAAIPAGTRLVQLGTFETAAAAEAGWEALAARFGDYLTPRGKIVEAADYGGVQVYRLRAHGFDDLAEARAFCAVFLAARADCIPVLTR